MWSQSISKAIFVTKNDLGSFKKVFCDKSVFSHLVIDTLFMTANKIYHWGEGGNMGILT